MIKAKQIDKKSLKRKNGRPIMVRLSEEDREHLQRIAESEDIPPATIVAQLARNYVRSEA